MCACRRNGRRKYGAGGGRSHTQEKKSCNSKSGVKPLRGQMGNPGRPSTSWPSSLEVVSWAAEKSDYLLLPVPPTERERVCVTVCLCVFVRASSHLSEECMTYIGKPKLANGLIASPVFTPPAMTLFCTLHRPSAHVWRRAWISIPLAGYDGTNED